ncbi:ricin-type beta-trefoil lectin domain protein [Kitasatospora sp. NPDC004289]
MRWKPGAITLAGAVGAALLLPAQSQAAMAPPAPGTYRVEGVYHRTVCLSYRNFDDQKFEVVLAYSGCPSDEYTDNVWTVTSDQQLRITGKGNRKTVCLTDTGGKVAGAACEGANKKQKWSFDKDRKVLKPVGRDVCLMWPSGDGTDTAVTLWPLGKCGQNNTRTWLTPAK